MRLYTPIDIDISINIDINPYVHRCTYFARSILQQGNLVGICPARRTTHKYLLAGTDHEYSPELC